jgi:hypothetical protein
LLLMSTNGSKHWQLGNLETWILWQYHTMVQLLLTVMIATPAPPHSPTHPPIHNDKPHIPISFKITITLI